ncbi:hypothetical protein B0H10DRAFT_2361570 [Mycena sp. CBHHK59/15]|nr:hypothetical protein B0H10DRAFT_2361570 [Mycena sp. CBHHK59/15]
MPNPSGINGYGDKTPPSEDVLKAALLRYASQNLKAEVRIANLKSDLNYSIGCTTLKKLQKKFNIPTVRKAPPIEVSRQAVIEQVEKDAMQTNGPNYFKTVLQQEGIMIPRDTIRKIMGEHYPLGFDNRFPGKRKGAIPRTALNSNGPFHEVSSDGHEKLGKQALDMGDIGLPIYGYKDKWTDTALDLRFVPNSRTTAAIGHLYLDFIETTGGVETVWINETVSQQLHYVGSLCSYLWIKHAAPRPGWWFVLAKYNQKAPTDSEARKESSSGYRPCKQSTSSDASGSGKVAKGKGSKTEPSSELVKINSMQVTTCGLDVRYDQFCTDSDETWPDLPG